MANQGQRIAALEEGMAGLTQGMTALLAATGATPVEAATTPATPQPTAVLAVGDATPVPVAVQPAAPVATPVAPQPVVAVAAPATPTPKAASSAKKSSTPKVPDYLVHAGWHEPGSAITLPVVEGAKHLGLIIFDPEKFAQWQSPRVTESGKMRMVSGIREGWCPFPGGFATALAAGFPVESK
jgi:hypothetical protein